MKVLISTVIYFKLSIFQKHHAEKRVFEKKLTDSSNKLTLPLIEYYENPMEV
jgi:hypothetical protein